MFMDLHFWAIDIMALGWAARIDGTGILRRCLDSLKYEES